MVQTLTRTTVSEDECSLPLVEFDEIGRQAHDVLGYALPVNDLTATNDEIFSSNAFHTAMRKLDIRPFNDRQVRRYKEKMAWKYTPLDSKSKLMAQMIREWIFLAILLGTPLTCLASWVARLFVGPGVIDWVLTWSFLGTLPIVALGLSFIFRDKTKDPKEDEAVTVPSAEWKLVPIQDYQGIVPEFALQTAIDLKTRCPEAVVYIDELVEGCRRLDPFLVVECAGLRYHIEVWNESDFKQKRVM